jgi:hypothetical protein
MCCGQETIPVKSTPPSSKSGKTSAPTAETPTSELPPGNNPIADLDCGVLVLLSDGKMSMHGYLLQGMFHNVHGRVIENFEPTHYFL